jgi:hypothetical protein
MGITVGNASQGSYGDQMTKELRVVSSTAYANYNYNFSWLNLSFGFMMFNSLQFLAISFHQRMQKYTRNGAEMTITYIFEPLVGGVNGLFSS